MTITDKELAAMARCVESLESCENDSRNRILVYLDERFRADPLWKRAAGEILEHSQAAKKILKKWYEQCDVGDATENLYNETEKFLFPQEDDT